MSDETYWRAVWNVPKTGAEGFRQGMERLQGDEFLGTNKWPDKESCEARAKSDVVLFSQLGSAISFVRAQEFPTPEQTP